MPTPTHDVLINCNSAVHGNAGDTNRENVNAAISCLLPSEVPMPFFSDSIMSDIKQLETYFVFKAVPKQLQLTIPSLSVIIVPGYSQVRETLKKVAVNELRNGYQMLLH
jgi:hypothetical protein